MTPYKAWKSLKVYLMLRRPTVMNEFQQTAFNTIDAINKKDEAKFYEGIAKLSKIDVRHYLKSFPIKAER